MNKILLTLAFIIALGGLSQAQDSDTPGPAIKFNKKVHDYGTIEHQSDGSCTFEFTNTGDQPLALTTVRSSCGCTVPKWPRKPVMPGDKGKIKVTYDTRRLGPINKQVTVRSNAKNGTIVLKIKGKVVKEQPNIIQKNKSDIE
ncbi:MAG: DUF1573 domain-containing protein [Bacteroidales bacterium]